MALSEAQRPPIMALSEAWASMAQCSSSLDCLGRSRPELQVVHRRAATTSRAAARAVEALS